MLTEGLLELAAMGGGAIVAAAATDAWQSTKGGVAQLFSRGGDREEQRISVQLDRIPHHLEQASEAEQDQIRTALADRWRVKLTELLEENPELEDELRALVEQVRASAPEVQQSFTQNNHSHDQSRQYVVQHGTIVINDDPDARQGS
ncbi:hypothetical protein KBZ94_09995 [Streptomyces sp. RM72]|uniref:hypothetical protein n=1 Tax=Streptomyces sp. RM72 TaxID=1115510 RepID=UPI001B394EA8|nr:hypothetical protein [Streptomyces sp. RM72]MBQ0885270.1 hypothetical protein [Streptomyces sp. RM72]